MEMFQKNDVDHLKAMNNMKEIMTTPEAMNRWFENKWKEFSSLSEDK